MIREFPEILTGCRAGDPAALRLLMMEFYGTMMRAARQRYRDEESARDAVQSFFLFFLERRLVHKFRGATIAQFRSFLLVCFRKHSDTEVRRAARFQKDADVSPDSLESQRPSAEEEFERHNIRELVSQIDWRFRQVLDLELESYRQREIAEMLNLPMGTVASYSYRAKAELSRLLRLHGFLVLPFFLSILLHVSESA